MNADHGRVEPKNKALSAPSSQSKIEQLRELITHEHEKLLETNVVPSIYRDDYGRVISEGQWKALQKRKSEAVNHGYEIDEHSQ